MIDTRAPLWFSIVAAMLTIWDAIGCYVCFLQFRFGADAMPGATAYDRALMAALPLWYNPLYAVAVGGATLGSLALLARSRFARPIFAVSLLAIIVQFGWLFATTDLIAHKGFATVVPFPAFIVGVAVFALWLSDLAIRRGWLR